MNPLRLAQRLVPVLVLALASGCRGPVAADAGDLQAALERGEWSAASLRGVRALDADAQLALLRVALRRPGPDLLDDLIAAGIDVDAQGGESVATALMYAAYANDQEKVARLIAAGAALDRVDSHGDPAINWAVYAGNRETTAQLVAAGADLTRSGHGTALEIALRRGDFWIARLLCEASGCRPPATPAEEQALAALERGDWTDLHARLAALGAAARESLRDHAGRPILLRAAQLGHADVVAGLLADGTPVDVSDAVGFTALMEAAREGHTEVVRLLLRHGADAGHEALPGALSFRPVHLAALSDELAVLAALVEAGADVDVVDTDGTPPLVWALYEERSRAAAWLVEHGADTSITNSYGDSGASLMATDG